jgi:hypothetical protein
MSSSAADAKAAQTRLRCSYSRHHNLVDRYEIFISQMTMNFLLFTKKILSSITAKTCTGSCNMNAFFSFDLFMVCIPECKQ